ncbi:hypothetical protein CRUP_017897 [Coryphaenoides rupestris]|nr:hypothetical protein CRUP_017897 [Coryphaenoides rupestris]
MNLVGQLAETVYVTVKELYRGLNPATLTGGIDVIVVRQPDGSYQCSPFHVRFGKLGVLRSKEKVVDIEINGEPVNLHMKLGDNGEAFFCQPISAPPRSPWNGPRRRERRMPRAPLVGGGGGPPARRKKRRRKRIRSDSHLREEGSSSSDEREKEKEKEREHAEQESPAKEQYVSSLQASKSIYFSISEEPVSTQTREAHPHSEGECSPSEGVFHSHPSSPMSDSELVVKAQESSGPQMQWNWGGFPKVCQSAERFPHFRTIERQASFDDSFQTTIHCSRPGGVTVVRPQPRTVSIDLDLFSSEENTPTQEIIPLVALSAPNRPPNTLALFATVSTDSPVNHLSQTDSFEGETTLMEACPSDPEQEDRRTSPVKLTDLSESARPENGLSKDETRAIVDPESTLSDAMSDGSVSQNGKRSQHLGPTGIYLDDLTTLDPEVAALYFPKSGAMDSGTEYLSDSATDAMDISMSLCGNKFKEHIVSYTDFFSNPAIIEDPNLVICINSQYYNWAVAAPMILSKQAFQKSLPKSAVDRLVKDKMPKKSGRWWLSWRRRDMDIKQPKTSTQKQEEASLSAPATIKASLDDMYSDEEAGLGRQAAMPTDNGLPTDTVSQCISQMYRKSLRLTTEQIYQGTCRCEAAIYLWNWDDRVIISDIDGTITKSDALGHILPQFGKDWDTPRHRQTIPQNDTTITKDYLQWVNDKGTVLPKGPVLLAPSSLFSALHREVIEKKPEVFKIACLTDIQGPLQPTETALLCSLWQQDQLGVPDTRIFTINPKGELTQEKTKGNKSSSASAFECPEFSHFSYWREPLPPLDLGALP